jgi:phenylpropionate dioxygenase-like ring-hydroxylating dioxygenase large terminal subunit
MLERTELVALTKRMLAHLEAGTTDQVDEQHTVPVSHYLDPERFQRELDCIFMRQPMPLALSCELKGPHTYKAMEAVGVPVLITRGADGEAQAFLNVCRHRGATVAAEGCGTARRFACPYHGWTFDDAGSLVGIYGETSFGEVDRQTHGLTPLPCAERAGFIFVVLRPEGSMDIDTWLGDLPMELDRCKLADWHVFSQRELPSPGWKIAYDGYLEGYHFASLHRETLFKDTHSNLMAMDRYGPHQRVVFARRSLADLRDAPEDDWVPQDHVGPVYTIFPSVALAGSWSDIALVSQLFPGPTADRSRTVQTIITRHPVDSEEAAAKARGYGDFLFQVVRDEDYSTGLGIQRNLASGANAEFIFGRNESSLHHFHRWVDRLLKGAG